MLSPRCHPRGFIPTTGSALGDPTLGSALGDRLAWLGCDSAQRQPCGEYGKEDRASQPVGLIRGEVERGQTPGEGGDGAQRKGSRIDDRALAAQARVEGLWRNNLGQILIGPLSRENGLQMRVRRAGL